MAMSAADRQQARRDRLKVSGGRDVLVPLSPQALKHLRSVMKRTGETQAAAINRAVLTIT